MARQSSAAVLVGQAVVGLDAAGPACGLLRPLRRLACAPEVRGSCFVIGSSGASGASSS